MAWSHVLASLSGWEVVALGPASGLAVAPSCVVLTLLVDTLALAVFKVHV